MKILLNSFPKSGTNFVEEFLKLNGFTQNQKSISPTRYLFRHGLKKIRKLDPVYLKSRFEGSIIDIGYEQYAPYPKRLLISRLPQNDYTYTSSHIAHSDMVSNILKNNDTKMIFVYRNSIDVLISYVNYCMSTKEHIFYPFTMNKTKEYTLHKLLSGGKIGPYKLRSWLQAEQSAHKWLEVENPNIFPIKYEDISDNKKSINVKNELQNFLKIELKNHFSDVYGRGKTYRSKSSSVRKADAHLKLLIRQYYE